MKDDNPEEAITEFLEIPKLEQDADKKGEWGFKALKQAIKAELKLGKYDDVSFRPPWSESMDVDLWLI